MALARISDTLEIIGRYVRPLDTCVVPLDQALGLTLAGSIQCDIDYPPFDKAMMDGFAVRAMDCQSPGTSLHIAGEIPAGGQADREVASGQAVRINTGAPLPPGADAVVMIEHAEISPDGQSVVIRDSVRPGQHIARRGVDIRAGDVVLAAGTHIGPAQIAALAAAGAGQVEVCRRPRVAVLVTGDELVDISTQPGPGQIRNSNGPCLLALARQAGCEVVDLGVVGDDRPRLAERLREGLAADVLCITGGMSMGQHDYVPGVLAEVGVRLEVQKIAIKPGKPTAFGVGPAGQLIFGLPGNPVSCFVGFTVFVRAALAGLQGREVAPPPTIPAALECPLRPAGARAEYIPACLRPDEAGGWRVSPVRWQGSGDPFGLARANGLIVRAADAPGLEAGEIVGVVLIE